MRTDLAGSHLQASALPKAEMEKAHEVIVQTVTTRDDVNHGAATNEVVAMRSCTMRSQWMRSVIRMSRPMRSCATISRSMRP